MKSTYWMIALLGAAVLVMPGCKKTHEDIAEEGLDTMEEMADVLATVKDEASAKEAKPKIEKLAEKMKELEKEAKAMGDPDEATAKAIEEKFGARGKEVAGKFLKEMMRVGLNPKLNEAMGDSLKGMSKSE